MSIQVLYVIKCDTCGADIARATGQAEAMERAAALSQSHACQIWPDGRHFCSMHFRRQVSVKKMPR